jgi:transposase
LIKEGARSIVQVARDLDLTESAVRNWAHPEEVDAGTREGLGTAEREALQALRAENRPTQDGARYLKKAAAFFAKESR